MHSATDAHLYCTVLWAPECSRKTPHYASLSCIEGQSSLSMKTLPCKVLSRIQSYMLTCKESKQPLEQQSWSPFLRGLNLHHFLSCSCSWPRSLGLWKDISRKSHHQPMVSHHALLRVSAFNQGALLCTCYLPPGMFKLIGHWSGEEKSFPFCSGIFESLATILVITAYALIWTYF